MLAVVVFTYGSILHVNYAFADDYFYLWRRVHQSNWITQMLVEGVLQARPLDGFLLTIALTSIKSVGAYVYLRAFTLLEVAGLAYLIYGALIQGGWTKLQSFFLSLSLVSLPPVQVICAWSNCSFYLFAAMLAFISIKIVIAKQAKGIISQVFSALPFLLFSMTIYQPWSMFYWLALAIHLSSRSIINKEKWSCLRSSTVVFFLAAVLDFFIMVIGKSCFKQTAVSPERSHLTKHVLEKLSWFLNGPLVDALNVNHLMANTVIAFVAGVYILGGLWLYLKSEQKRQSLLSWAIAISFVPLAYVPNLAIAESYYTYRTEFGLSVLVMFYIYLSTKAYLQQISKLHTKLVLSTVIVFSSLMNLVIAHNHTIDFFVSPQLHESEMLKAELRGDFGESKKLQPVYPERGDTTAPFNRHDEFGMPSFACPWVREPGTVILRDEINRLINKD